MEALVTQANNSHFNGLILICGQVHIQISLSQVLSDYYYLYHRIYTMYIPVPCCVKIRIQYAPFITLCSCAVGHLSYDVAKIEEDYGVLQS